MLSLSSSFRLFSHKLPQNPNLKPISSIHKTLFVFCSPISFQRIAPPSSSQSLRARSHPQQQQSDSSSASASDLSSDDNVTKHLPQALREIVSLFQSVGDDPKAKYQQLLHYCSQLPPLDPRFKNNDYRVRGCVSQVWVRAFPDPADPVAVRFEADSDSALTKGLAALLVFGLSGSPASVISSVPPEFILLLGLQQSLTPSRNNGFLNMLILMQKKARELHGIGEEICFDDEEKNLTTNVNGWKPLDYAASKRKNDGSSAETEEILVSKDKDVEFEIDSVDGRGSSSHNNFDAWINNIGHVNVEDRPPVIDRDVDGYHLSFSSGCGGRGERIKKLLERTLSPLELDVDDISYLHAGHAGIGGNRSGETHFNVRVVSEKFEGKSMVKRHRLVYEMLRDELLSGLHSISIIAQTPTEIKRIN